MRWNVRTLVLVVTLALGARRLAAQDSVIVIDPDRPLVDTLDRRGPPAEAIRALIALFNDSATTRLQGDVSIPPGTELAGRLAMYRGTLRIGGRVRGDVGVANGTLVLGDGAMIEGDILVVGGRLLRSDGATVTGTERVYWDAAPVMRTSEGLLAPRERRRDLGDLATAETRFRVGKVHTTLSLGTGRTYDRVEGLPIVFGPSFEYPFSPVTVARLDLRGLLRTVGGGANLRSEWGYTAQGELRFGGPRGVGIGGRLLSVIDPIEDQPLVRSESGWSAFLLQRDYRDYFERQGGGGYIYGYPAAALRLEASYQFEAQRSVQASDPWSLLRNSDRWRPNPLIDDGHYHTVALQADFDTRNERDFPTAGWLVHARLEHGESGDVGPVVLPTSVRDPIPTDGSYGFERLALDVRRYTRLTPNLRLNARIMADGRVSGGPLPVQRRLSLGGPDILPGYDFRAFTCAPAEREDRARTALCDRMIAAQVEVRTRLSLNLGVRVPDRSGEKRFVGIEEADLVFFGDAGKAWLAGDGPGKIPANRLPVLREWRTDIGLGLDAGEIGVYVAKALSEDEPVHVIVRLQQRF